MKTELSTILAFAFSALLFSGCGAGLKQAHYPNALKQGKLKKGQPEG